ncbi:MAG: IS66 family transposase [Minicystis sp.]
MARDWRDDRIGELETQLAERDRLILELRTLVEALQGRVRGLEARLAQTSSNSSRPPSSDPPGASPPVKQRPSGRKRGAQPGHKKHERKLLPPEQVTHLRNVKPSHCRACRKALEGEDPSPYRHQVVDVPKVKPEVREYRLHSLLCEGCNTFTRAKLPEGVPTGNFGPRLQAMVAVCSGAYRMSKRAVEELVGDFFGIEICLESVSNLEQATSEALAKPVEEVAKAIQQEPIVHADETGWYERSKRAWLWAAVTAQLAVFLVRKSRGAGVARELLGDLFAGILVSDRWSAYTWVSVLRRQICWAHLLRHFIGFQDHGPEAKAIGSKLELLTEAMFHQWHRIRDGTLSRAEFRDFMERLRPHILNRLHEGAQSGIAKVAGRCREILELEPAMWTFVNVEGVEPTNNAAERIVRHGVLWRKGSFGTDSPAGSRFVERILTTVMTLRLQKRNVLDFVTEACVCALLGRRPPSLLPKPRTQQASTLAA